MLMLLLALGCRPELETEAFVLPGRMDRPWVEVTDDGHLLTISRRPIPILDPILPALHVLAPLMFVGMGIVLKRTRRVAGISTIAVSVVVGVATAATSKQIGIVTLDRTARVVSIQDHMTIGLRPAPLLLPFSEIEQIGVVLLPVDGPSRIALDLTTTDGTLYSMNLGTDKEPDGVIFAEALRDHMASAARIEQVAETRQRWWWEALGVSTPESLK